MHRRRTQIRHRPMVWIYILFSVCVVFLAVVGVLLLMHWLLWSCSWPGPAAQRGEGYRRAFLDDLEADRPRASLDDGRIQPRLDR